MREFRVTKYDPWLRDANGYYLKRDEWTYFAQVGRTLGGETLTLEAYAETEDRYVEALFRFMAAAGTLMLRVTTLVKPLARRSKASASPVDAMVRAVRNGDAFHGDTLAILVRCILRNEIWARLVADDGFFVHFGDDYYMYIGVNDDEFIAPPMPPGIFVEPFHSPYHDEDLPE
jgi:hypothetical protein